MNTVLRYGETSEVTLDVAPEALVRRFDGPADSAVEDVAAATQAALLHPMDFPTLAEATVPGDHVTVSLDAHVPQAAEVVAGVIRALISQGIAADEITLVRTHTREDTYETPPTAALPPDVRDAIRVVTHDSRTRGDVAYVGATDEGWPIYLNRAIVDADLVIPIGCWRVDPLGGATRGWPGLFPAFSNRETIDALAREEQVRSADGRRASRRQAREVAWQLGVQLAVMVIPAGGDEVLAVLAGAHESVFRQAHRRSRQAWTCDLPQRAELVVAAVDGGTGQQSWRSLSQALVAARKAVCRDGAIVLCSDLQNAPGPAVQQLATADDLDQALRSPDGTRHEDALDAEVLLHTLQTARVFLLSRLEQELVESLGMAFVDQADEIDVLTNRFDTCIVLGSAQHTRPMLPQATHRRRKAR